MTESGGGRGEPVEEREERMGIEGTRVQGDEFDEVTGGERREELFKGIYVVGGDGVGEMRE